MICLIGLSHVIAEVSLFNNVIGNEEEGVFKYSSDIRASVVIVQMAATYNYDVVVRRDSSKNRLIAKIENIVYSDKMDDPTAEDIAALQIPFIVDLNEDGDWDRITISPKDNKFSMDQKDTILSLMTFNQTKISDVLSGDDNNTQDISSEIDETPLGNCTLELDVTKLEDGDFEFGFSAKRTDCNGKSEFEIDGNEVTPDSVFGIKIRFSSNPITFKRAQLSMNVGIDTSPKMRVKGNFIYEFEHSRPATKPLDLDELTLTYTEEAFQGKLEEFKEKDNDE